MPDLLLFRAMFCILALMLRQYAILHLLLRYFFYILHIVTQFL